MTATTTLGPMEKAFIGTPVENPDFPVELAQVAHSLRLVPGLHGARLRRQVRPQLAQFRMGGLSRSHPPPTDTLVVGCGNLIRGDDAAGPCSCAFSPSGASRQGCAWSTAVPPGWTSRSPCAGPGASSSSTPPGSASSRAPSTGCRARRWPTSSPPRATCTGSAGTRRWASPGGCSRTSTREDIVVWLIEGASFEAGAPLTPAVQEAVERVAAAILRSPTGRSRRATARWPLTHDAGSARPRRPSRRPCRRPRGGARGVGRWMVYLDVVLASGAVRRRVGDHPDERRAGQAARIIERNARRHVRPAGWRGGPVRESR